MSLLYHVSFMLAGPSCPLRPHILFTYYLPYLYVLLTFLTLLTSLTLVTYTCPLIIHKILYLVELRTYDTLTLFT